MFNKPLDEFRILFYKSMNYEAKWMNCSVKLAAMFHNIIEFIKMIPGYTEMSHSDQIMLIRSSSFDLVIVRLSRLIDLNRDQVLYGDDVLPIRECFQAEDPRDRTFVTTVFEAAKSIAQFQLTETELALYQCLVVLWPERREGIDNADIRRIFIMTMTALQHEIDTCHTFLTGGVSIMDILLAKIQSFRKLSLMHQESLSRFIATHPHHVFPDIYKELYCHGSVLGDAQGSE